MATKKQNLHSHRNRVKRYDIPMGIHYETFPTARPPILLTNDRWRMQLAQSVRTVSVTTPEQWKFSSYRWLEMNDWESAPPMVDD